MGWSSGAEPVIRNQVWRHRFAEHRAGIEAARWLVYRAVDLMNRHKKADREVSMAKLFTTDLAQHFDLCEFNDEEIQTFIRGWRLAPGARTGPRGGRGEHRQVVECDRGGARHQAAGAEGAAADDDDKGSFGLGELPDSRLELYAKCVERLLKSWTEAAGLPRGALDRHQKEKSLGDLAFELQSSHPEEMREGGIALRWAATRWRGGWKLS